MPSQKQEFSFPGQTTDQLSLFAYGTLFGWKDGGIIMNFLPAPNLPAYR